MDQQANPDSLQSMIYLYMERGKPVSVSRCHSALGISIPAGYSESQRGREHLLSNLLMLPILVMGSELKIVMLKTRCKGEIVSFNQISCHFI